ncbi:anti-sigma factor [Aquimarina hainanensis]|uniref:Anti-sigma factor n=1 Tax=Aquimarina hainanensis TaxID=1578017 RepID=A0ABW5N3S8_9FLAO|nr:anti-sigma factor [Aquimarina sp. TRL1]QKX05801.1 anti-sigma factor [Aquimarina sp. TRL1]
MIKKVMIGAIALGVMLSSCNNDDDNSGTDSNVANLNIDLKGLEDLGDGYLYEGWIIVDGAPVSTGTFSVDGEGALSQKAFEVTKTSLETATAFVLTIEPDPDSDPAPADTKLLLAEFGSGNTASVSLAPVAEGDFATSSGDFFLRSPTDEASGTANNMNDQYGVWFGQPAMPPLATLNLPTLNAGWKYEGWVVTENGPLSTGTFTAVNEADDNAGSPEGFSGTESFGPPIPGEDFFRNAPEGVTFPLDVRGKTVVISVEPFPDNSPAPFLLKPLVGTAGTETAPTHYPFGLNAASFPSGTVSR